MLTEQQEEILAWLSEAGIEVQRKESGGIALREIVTALGMQMIALEERLAKVEHG